MGGIKMNKNKLQEAIYLYLVLYRKGITVQDIIDNKIIFVELSDELYKKNKEVCNINLKFKYRNDVLFEIKSCASDDEFMFQVDINRINIDALSKLLFGQVTCSDFLCINSQLINNTCAGMDFKETIKESTHSWNKFIDRVGYNEDDFIVSEESTSARKLISEERILWCFNKSCTGKTFLGLNSLEYCNYIKFVYNPTVNNTCDLNILKIFLEYGTDCSLLIDDLQCDVELARQLLSFICDNKDSIKARNMHIFLTSWSSLI